MPSAQVINLNPEPRTELTPLEKTLSSFSKRSRENQIEQQDTDALRDIYGEYQRDGKNLEDALINIQTRPGLSPTARVNAANQLMNFSKHNAEIQKKAREDVEKSEKQANQAIIAKDLQDKRNLTPEQAAAYAANPALIDKVYPKESKKTQASQPIDEDQLKRIQHVESKPEFATATLPEKKKMLRDALVSKENSDSVIDAFVEQEKLANERKGTINKKQAEADFNFVNEQVEALPKLFARQETLAAADDLNEEGVTGGAWDLAMQKAGLLQYTSDGYRQFASYAKEAVKNQNIKSVVGSQISQMEFGFFRDATISERFSKEANRQIMKKENLALRYEKLYADITKSMVEQNDGVIPERIQDKVNAEFAKQSKKISKELKETATDFEAIQNVPPGKVLMYDTKRRPLHVNENEVEKYTKLGASLS